MQGPGNEAGMCATTWLTEIELSCDYSAYVGQLLYAMEPCTCLTKLCLIVLGQYPIAIYSQESSLSQ